MKKALFLIGWICCCFSIHAQIREIPESEYGQFAFTYDQVLKLGRDRYYEQGPFYMFISEIKIDACFDSVDCQYYWRYSIVDMYYSFHLKINAFTGGIKSENLTQRSPNRHMLYCKVFEDPDLPRMKRRLLGNFETVDLEEYNKYKEGENYSVRILPGGIEGVWEKGDSTFRYYEFIINKDPVSILLLKEFYANGNIKRKGIHKHTHQDCPPQIGLWYYFDPEGNLTDVVDEDGRELCLLTNEEMIAYCKERFRYSKGHDDEYRVRMAGLPDIRIDKWADFERQRSLWTIRWYAFEPDLVKFELKLEGMHERLSVLSRSKTKVSLEKELEQLKAEKR